MTRRLLILVVVILIVANVMAATAWFFREELETAGLLPPSQLPTRADLPVQPLPALGTDTLDKEANPDAPTAVGVPTDDAPAADEPDVVAADEQAPEQEELASVPSAAPDDQTPPAADGAAAPVDDAAAPANNAGALPADAAPTAPTPTEQPQTHSADGETVDSTTCVLAGAFRRREPAVRASERLAAQGAEVAVVVESVVGDPQYHVFVAPATSNDEAQRVARELTAEGVNSYVVTSGPRAGGVAVGVFHSERRAQAQKARVAKLGYDVRLATAQQERQMFRVRATGAPPSALAGIPHQPCPKAPEPQDRSLQE